MAVDADREEQDPGISDELHYNGLHANRLISALLGAEEARAHRRSWSFVLTLELAHRQQFGKQSTAVAYHLLMLHKGSWHQQGRP